MGNKGYFLYWVHEYISPHTQTLPFPHLVCRLKTFTLSMGNRDSILHKPFTIFWSEEEGHWGSSALWFLLRILLVFVCVCVCVLLCSVLFLCTSLSPFSGLALAIRDQEYHGFLFANVSHDRGQLVDVAAVEMLCLPQVQDHRGWARFGCKETHVSAVTEQGRRAQK